jgi:hypothetical protein
VQNALSSSLLSKNINIKAYTTTFFLLLCKGVKLGKNKKDPQPPMFAHSRKCYTCNQTFDRTRGKNLNYVKECIL